MRTLKIGIRWNVGHILTFAKIMNSEFIVLPPNSNATNSKVLNPG